MRNLAFLFFFLALSCPAQTNSLAFDDSAPPPWYPLTLTQWTNLPVGVQALWDAHQLPRTNAQAFTWSCQYYDTALGSNVTQTTSWLATWPAQSNCYCLYFRDSGLSPRAPISTWGVTMLPPTATNYPMFGAGNPQFPQGWFRVERVNSNGTIIGEVNGLRAVQMFPSN